MSTPMNNNTGSKRDDDFVRNENDGTRYPGIVWTFFDIALKTRREIFVSVSTPGHT